MKIPKVSLKKPAILNSGRELFWKHGFRRVSVDEVCKVAGVSKMTFYRYYPDKMALAKAVFDTEVEKGMIRFRELLESDLSTAEKMQGILKMKSDSVNSISQEFLKDFYTDNGTGLKNYVNEKTARSWEVILEDFKKAQDKGDFRKDFKPELLLFIAQKLADFINDPYLTGLYGSPQEVVMELARFFTYGISPENMSQKTC